MPSRSTPVPRRGSICVAVVEEHEILRRGLIASLSEDERVEVKSGAGERLPTEVDVAVVSDEAARASAFPCPIVICTDDPDRLRIRSKTNDVVGVLHRGTMTEAQLRATVFAAAAGLHVAIPAPGPVTPVLDARATRVLELLADGFSTREIAEHLNYSERTIKKTITLLEERLDARSRPQIVARAIRHGVI